MSIEEQQQRLKDWILKQPYFTLEPQYDGMPAWELAGIILQVIGEKQNG